MKKTTLQAKVLFVSIVLTMIAMTVHALSSGNAAYADRTPVTTQTPARVQMPVNRSKPAGQALTQPPGGEDMDLRAQGEVIPSVGINLSGKMDVALAIGKPTFTNNTPPGTIAYGSFQNELRRCFNGDEPLVDLPKQEDYVTTTQYYTDKTKGLLWNWLQEPAQVAKYGQNIPSLPNGDKDLPMLPNGDLYIDASTMSTISTKGSFAWWEYDHAPTASISTTPGVHKYHEAVGNQSNNAYNAMNPHIQLSPDGSSMTFYGYGSSGYIDFTYLPHTEPTRKVFEFSIQEEEAGHTLDGVGFFFNCKIDTTSAYGSGQKMTGYLLLLGYTSANPAVGKSITIYKFKDADTKILHHTGNINLSDQNGPFSYAGSGNNWQIVARSTVYAIAGNRRARHIKIEVDPEYVRMWYIGGSETETRPDLDGNPKKIVDIKIDSLPDAARDAALITGGQWTFYNGNYVADVPGGIELDQSYILEDGYGFGPMASYRSHGCDQTTKQQFRQLTMTSGSVRKLHEVVADPHWHDKTKRVLVNLNLQEIEDFSTAAQTGDLLARVIKDDVYYIGWCSSDNETKSQQFADASNPAGTLINVQNNAYNDGSDPTSIPSRNIQILEMAKVIYDVWYKANVGNRVLVTDDVSFAVSPTEMGENTAEPGTWPDGKWKFVHISPIELGWDVTSAAENMAHHPKSSIVNGMEKRMSNLDIDFIYPGEYKIYYRDVLIKTIEAHRKPETQITAKINSNGDVEEIKDISVDPDDLTNGIVKKTWKYIQFFDDNTPPRTGTDPQTDITHLNVGDVYLIELTVEDKWGATTTTAKTLKGAVQGGTKQPPMAMFDLSPVTVIQGLTGQQISIAESSFDDYGGTLDYEWKCKKSSSLEAAIKANVSTTNGSGSYSTSALAVGEYKVELTVETNDVTQPPSLLASRTFWVVKDDTPPIATVDKPAGTYVGYTTVTLTFEDDPVYDNNSMQHVMSGFEGQCIHVSPTQIPPAGISSLPWGTLSDVNNQAVDLPVGENYIYWKAVDKVGNVGYGEFGKYDIQKIPTQVELDTTPDLVVFGKEDVILTAKLPPSRDPYENGTIEFWMNGVLLGVADIIRGTSGPAPNIYTAQAMFNATPDHATEMAGSTSMTFEARFIGDKIHAPGSDQITNYPIKVNQEAKIEIALTLGVGATSKVYDATGNPIPNVTVEYPADGGTSSDFEISYTGMEYGTTNYGPIDATPPIKVGHYKATARTTSLNYAVQYDDVDFDITSRMVTVAVTHPTPTLGQPLTFTATVGNLVDQPQGTVKFYRNGVEVSQAGGEILGSVSGTQATATWTWPSVETGTHIIMAVFEPTVPSNYATNNHTIAFDVSKASQSIYFVYENTTTTIPDEDPLDGYPDQTLAGVSGITFGAVTEYRVEAIGGAGTGSITYELVSQTPFGGTECVEFNPMTRRLRIKGAGECWIKATKAADAQYNGADTLLLVKIAKAAGNVTVAVNSVDYLVPINPQVTNLSGGALTYSYSGTYTNGTPYGPTPTPPTQAGSYTLTVSSAATANYEAVVPGITAGFTIDKIHQAPIQLNHGCDTTVWSTQVPFTLPVTGGSGTGTLLTWSITNPKTPPAVTVNTNGLISIDTAQLDRLTYITTLTVTKAGDNNYFDATTLQNVTVESKGTELSADASAVLPPDFVKKGKNNEIDGLYEWSVTASSGNPPFTWEVKNLPKGMYPVLSPPDNKTIIIRGTAEEVFFDSVLVTVSNTQNSLGVTPAKLEIKVPVAIYPPPTASTDEKTHVEINEEMVVSYPIPMDMRETGYVTVNGRPASGYWLSDEEFVIPPPFERYEYETNYKVVISRLEDKNGAIKRYIQEFTFRTGQRPRPPVIAREVIILPLPEGVMSEPTAEVEHLILSGEDFIFTLFVPDGMEPSVATNRVIAGAPERLKGERIDDTNTYRFVVRQIRQEGVEISVLIESRNDVGNGTVAEPRLWSHGGKLYVETAQEGVLSVYTMTGELCLQESVVAGNTRFTLPQGVYVAKLHGKVYKALIH